MGRSRDNKALYEIETGISSRAPQSPQALENPFCKPVLGAQLSTSPLHGPREPTRTFCPWGALFSSPISVPWQIQSTALLPGSYLCLQQGAEGGSGCQHLPDWGQPIHIRGFSFSLREGCKPPWIAITGLPAFSAPILVMSLLPIIINSIPGRISGIPRIDVGKRCVCMMLGGELNGEVLVTLSY